MQLSPEHALSLFVSGKADLHSPPHILFVFAHTEDAVIRASSRLWRWASSASMVCVTDGAPRVVRAAGLSSLPARSSYAKARREEMRVALAMGGISASQISCWNAPEEDASLHLASLVESAAAVLRRLRPDIVVTLPYEGEHPDHDATAFAMQAACLNCEAEGIRSPVLLEMLSACGQDDARFPVAGSVESIDLSAEAYWLKQEMLACFKAQSCGLSPAHLSVERFRLAPGYDFSKSPRAGVLAYEKRECGMTGERWRALGCKALRDQEASLVF